MQSKKATLICTDKEIEKAKEVFSGWMFQEFSLTGEEPATLYKCHGWMFLNEIEKIENEGLNEIEKIENEALGELVYDDTPIEVDKDGNFIDKYADYIQIVKPDFIEEA